MGSILRRLLIAVFTLILCTSYFNVNCSAISLSTLNDDFDDSCNGGHAVECDDEDQKNVQSTVECNLDPQIVQEIANYKTIADTIISEVLQGSFKGKAYDDLEHFVDTFGPRFSGTATLEKAIYFMLDRMRDIGLENVHGENASIPQWVRYAYAKFNYTY